ncbi:MmpS family transport accessory protein [Streptomyces sp. NPDC089919]|uniref:MmpS family transport accessory protein n=1 Tax=Streptomyces sp. NPDC089919 TaxID=3155188 RepID=UPI003425617C
MFSSRTARTALAAAVVLLASATACSSSEVVDKVDKAVDTTYEVTYEVTGKGVESIEYAAGGGTANDPEMATVKGAGATLPWKKTVTLRGIMPASVMPVATEAGTDTLTCKITYKGKTLATQSGPALTKAGACVAVSPVAD